MSRPGDDPEQQHSDSGCLIGFSEALHEEVTFDTGAITSIDWGSYAPARTQLSLGSSTRCARNALVGMISNVPTSSRICASVFCSFVCKKGVDKGAFTET
jgi:hypothetical protein